MEPTGDDIPNAMRDSVRYADPAARALLEGGLAGLAHPQAPHWRQVKDNSSRTVYRGEIAGQPVYLKHFHSRSWAHCLARRLGASDAFREMRFLQYLSSSGVPVAAPLAACWSGKSEWVATRAVEPSLPADQWHAAALDRGAPAVADVRRATLALAELVGRMHVAGVIHRDLHCGNILVRTGEGGAAAELVLMDLHRVRRRRRLSRRLRAANLAQLFHDRYDLTTRSDRLRFLKRYLEVSGGPGSLRGWQVLVEHFARRHTRRQYAHLDRRIAGANKYFHPIKIAGGWRGCVVLASKWLMPGSQAARATFTPQQWREALACPADLLQGPDATVVKESASSLVLRRTLTVGGTPLTVYIKQTRRKRWWKAMLDCFRASKALRAFRLGHVILSRHVATALPLAAVERRVGPLLLDSILITEAIEGPTLQRYLTTTFSHESNMAPADLARQRQLAQTLLERLGRIVQRLHDNNLAHRDLKAQNILVQLSSPSPEVVLVDLDGLKPRMWLSAYRRFQGVMRLNVSLLKCPSVSHAGRLRLLLGYLRRPGMGRIDYKPYWRVLEEWSARKLRQQIRSGRKRQRAARRPA